MPAVAPAIEALAPGLWQNCALVAAAGRIPPSGNHAAPCRSSCRPHAPAAPSPASPWPDVADSTGHLPRHPGRILKATLWSLQGLRAAWLHESSFRLEVYLFLVLAPLGWWLGDTGVERALLIGSGLLVMSVELLNSAVEAVIERYGPEHHELAGRAKDMGSAAVFVLMMNVLLVWGLIVGPKLL